MIYIILYVQWMFAMASTSSTICVNRLVCSMASLSQEHTSLLHAHIGRIIDVQSWSCTSSLLCPSIERNDRECMYNVRLTTGGQVARYKQLLATEATPVPLTPLCLLARSIDWDLELRSTLAVWGCECYGFVSLLYQCSFLTIVTVLSVLW